MGQYFNIPEFGTEKNKYDYPNSFANDFFALYQSLIFSKKYIKSNLIRIKLIQNKLQSGPNSILTSPVEYDVLLTEYMELLSQTTLNLTSPDEKPLSWYFSFREQVGGVRIALTNIIQYNGNSEYLGELNAIYDFLTPEYGYDFYSLTDEFYPNSSLYVDVSNAWQWLDGEILNGKKWWEIILQNQGYGFASPFPQYAMYSTAYEHFNNLVAEYYKGQYQSLLMQYVTFLNISELSGATWKITQSELDAVVLPLQAEADLLIIERDDPATTPERLSEINNLITSNNQMIQTAFDEFDAVNQFYDFQSNIYYNKALGISSVAEVLNGIIANSSNDIIWIDLGEAGVKSISPNFVSTVATKIEGAKEQIGIHNGTEYGIFKNNQEQLDAIASINMGDLYNLVLFVKNIFESRRGTRYFFNGEGASTLNKGIYEHYKKESEYFLAIIVDLESQILSKEEEIAMLISQSEPVEEAQAELSVLSTKKSNFQTMKDNTDGILSSMYEATVIQNQVNNLNNLPGSLHTLYTEISAIYKSLLGYGTILQNLPGPLSIQLV